MLLVTSLTAEDKLALVLKKIPTKEPVTKVAKKYIGTRYKMGASIKTTKMFDCSSFVHRVIKEAKGKTLPRTAAEQYKTVKKVKHPKKRRFGIFQKYLQKRCKSCWCVFRK